VVAYGQSHEPSPSTPLVRDAAVRPATDDWPFLYMRAPGLPRHYLDALATVLVMSALAIVVALRGAAVNRTRPWRTAQFFFLGAGFMLLETKSIVQFALLWGSTWSSASLAIASVLTMALVSVWIAARVEIRRHGLLLTALLAMLAVNYLVPVGRVSFVSRAAESVFYGVLVFSPVLCAGILFSASYKQSSSNAADFGANLYGAMAGGVSEYLSLLTGYRALLILVGAAYALAVLSAERALHNAECGMRSAD